VEAAREYRGVVRGFVLDRQDSSLAGEIETLGFQVVMADTLMSNDLQRKNLAMEVLKFIQADLSG
jgi:hypothetical protein